MSVSFSTLLTLVGSPTTTSGGNMNPLWLILIIPSCVTAGFFMHALCAAAHDNWNGGD